MSPRSLTERIASAEEELAPFALDSLTADCDLARRDGIEYVLCLDHGRLALTWGDTDDPESYTTPLAQLASSQPDLAAAALDQQLPALLRAARHAEEARRRQHPPRWPLEAPAEEYVEE